MAFAHLSGNGCPMAKTPGVGKPMNKLPWLGPAVKARNQWVCNMPSPCIHQCPMLLHDCPMQLSNAQCPMHIIAQWSIPNTGAHCPMHHMHHVTCNATSHTNASAQIFHTHFPKSLSSPDMSHITGPLCLCAWPERPACPCSASASLPCGFSQSQWRAWRSWPH